MRTGGMEAGNYIYELRSLAYLWTSPRNWKSVCGLEGIMK